MHAVVGAKSSLSKRPQADASLSQRKWKSRKVTGTLMLQSVIAWICFCVSCFGGNIDKKFAYLSIGSLRFLNNSLVFIIFQDSHVPNVALFEDDIPLADVGPDACEDYAGTTINIEDIH